MTSQNNVFQIDCYPGAPTQPTETRSAEQFHFVPPGDGASAYVPKERAYFESSETDRLNQSHWQMVDTGETPINQVLADRLPIMRARSNHERINNPTIDGLALSHTLAVVGENGPLLDLVSESDADEQWCKDAEGVWEDWCKVADAAGELDLGGLLSNWNYNGWFLGEFLEQIVTEEDEFYNTNDVSLRLHGIEVQRLVTPGDSTMDPMVVCGIKRNKYKRAKAYWIRDDWYTTRSTNGRWYPARDILHGVDKVQAERGQARGIPWAQSGLPLSADLRDFDTQVLDAARLTADGAVFAFTRHLDAPFADNVPRSIQWRRRQINHIASGWELGSVHSNQPLPQYKDFRTERMNDLGRSKGVPGMVTRLDARDHNYSSARFDYQLLGESAKHLRSSLYNPKLRRLFLLVISEAILLGKITPPPKRFYQQWIWPPLPEIDATKAAEAETIALRNGTLTYSEACSRNHGRRSAEIIRQRSRDNARLTAAGLPTVAEATARSSAGNPGQPNNDAANNDAAADSTDSASNTTTK